MDRRERFDTGRTYPKPIRELDPRKKVLIFRRKFDAIFGLDFFFFSLFNYRLWDTDQSMDTYLDIKNTLLPNNVLFSSEKLIIFVIERHDYKPTYKIN